MNYFPREPYLSYLRIFEPLSAFKEGERNTWIDQEKHGLSREDIEYGEDIDGLHRLARFPKDLYPGLSIERALITIYEGKQYYCPLQKKLNVALAVLELEDTVSPALLDMIAPREARVSHKLGDILDVRLHTKISSWGIPLAWFVLISKHDQQNIIDLPRGEMTLRVTVPIALALQRAEEVYVNLKNSEYAIDIISDMEALMEWFEFFDSDSLIEVDYGPIASRTYPDESPEDIRLGIKCLLEGDMRGTAAAYKRLALRWIPIRQLSRAS